MSIRTRFLAVGFFVLSVTLQAQTGVWKEYTDPIDDSLFFYCATTTGVIPNGLTPTLTIYCTKDGILVGIFWGNKANGPQTKVVYRFPDSEPINSVWTTRRDGFAADAPLEIQDILGSESSRFLASMLHFGDVSVRITLDNGTWFTATFPTSKFSAFAYAFKERLRFGMLLSQPTQ